MSKHKPPKNNHNDSKPKFIDSDNSPNQPRVEAPFPHFRLYFKSGHPALIVGEQNVGKGDEYKFRGVSHNKVKGRGSDTVKHNPNPNDKKPMIIEHRVRHDEKKFFSPKPYPWKPPKLPK